MKKKKESRDYEMDFQLNKESLERLSKLMYELKLSRFHIHENDFNILIKDIKHYFAMLLYEIQRLEILCLSNKNEYKM